MSTNRRVVVEPSAEQLISVVATMVESVICEAVARSGTCSLALSGGTTPRGVYQHIAQTAVQAQTPWSAVSIFWGDERDVPHDNVESNYHMATRLLLDHLPLDPHRIYPMPADREDLDDGAAEYEETIRQVVPANDDGVPAFDLILLGMGADGHMASLFPGSSAVEETQRLVVAPFVPVLGRRRMTFTVPLLNAARCAIVLVTGEDKAQVMHEVFTDPAAKATRPAARIQLTDGTLIYALDAAAARQTAYAH
ncbi:MAG: 6-phosphogluconolactonase [Phycisphaerae bacterium]|nr:6-phosphogluconolactonase [Phycisphaerae bacterium]